MTTASVNLGLGIGVSHTGTTGVAFFNAILAGTTTGTHSPVLG